MRTPLQIVEELFHEAIQVPESEREDWLLNAGRINPEYDEDIIAQVRCLLESDAAAEGFLHQQVGDAAVGFHDYHNQPGLTRAGPYRLVSILGAGGMGTVYLAERDDEQYQGEAAVKLIRPGMDTAFVLARFRRERQTLARLQHPNIARLLDSGVASNGLPYIVMERIKGVAITDFCSSRQLDATQIVKLFRSVGDAVSHAHAHFVIHRDLKPGNILVDENGIPKLLDFGICKLLFESAGSRDRTSTQTHMMTPDYASPEQVQGEPVTVTSDIYSLGAVLYELLTGVRAHRIEKFTPRAVEQAICEAELVRPSRATQVRATSRQLQGDLDTILLKALQKEPQRRYQTVEQFSNDLTRYLEHLPVAARPDTVLYRSGKFARRHVGFLAAVACVVVALGIGLALSIMQARRAEQSFGQTRKLANSVLFDVYDLVKDLPGALKTRQTIVRLGTQYLDDLSNASQNDTDLRLELAEGYQRMGEVEGNILGSHTGEIGKALKSFQKAGDLLDTVPDSRRSQLDRLELLRRMGDLQIATDDAAAERTLTRASQIAEGLSRQYPDDLVVVESAASAATSLGRLAQRRGQYQQAVKHLEISRGLILKLAAAKPTDIHRKAAVADVTSMVGSAEFMAGQLSQARERLLESAVGWDALCGAEPDNVPFHRNRMLIYGHLGDLLGNPGYPGFKDREGGRRAYAVMLEEAEQSYRRNPADQGAIGDLGIAGLRLAVTTDKPEEKLRLLRQSEQLLMRTNPSNKFNRLNLGAVREQMGNALFELGRENEARTALNKSLLDAQATEGAASGLGSRALMLRVYRRLGEDAARNGDIEQATSLADKGVKLAESAAAEKKVSTAQRVMVPRSYAARGSIAELLGRKEEALTWRKRAYDAYQALSGESEFNSLHREEMQAMQIALGRKDR